MREVKYEAACKYKGSRYVFISIVSISCAVKEMERWLNSRNAAPDNDAVDIHIYRPPEITVRATFYVFGLIHLGTTGWYGGLSGFADETNREHFKRTWLKGWLRPFVSCKIERSE